MGEQQINTYYYISIQNVFTTHLSFSPLFVVFPRFEYYRTLYIWWPKKKEEKMFAVCSAGNQIYFPLISVLPSRFRRLSRSPIW